MINKIKEAEQLLSTKIRYEDNGHNYYRISDNKLLAGVSSVSSLVKSKDSDGWLAQWKVNEALSWIKDWLGRLDSLPEDEDIDLAIKEAKYAHKEKGKEACDIGTEIHALLEEYVNHRIKGEEVVLFADDEITKLFADDFLKWETANSVQWLASELLVGDLENDVAGRLDALAMVNGKLTIIDFKCANSIPSYYFVQLAGYALCLESMGIKVEDRIIIRLPKTLKRKVWVEEKKQYQTLPNKIEFITPKTDWSFDKECFIHARQLYKWLNYANK